MANILIHCKDYNKRWGMFHYCEENYVVNYNSPDIEMEISKLWWYSDLCTKTDMIFECGHMNNCYRGSLSCQKG